MIIPIRCMNCGFLLADKWRYYQARVSILRKQNPDKYGSGNEPKYIDGSILPDTAERAVCDELQITRYCCRKHLLTHRDLIEKI
jgi:DNA-directed RNA polymerase subunit N (RpoN/RPB10)